MPFSGHARFSNGFRFSSKKPPGKAIHDSFRASYDDGEGVARGGPLDARLFAFAMAIARQQSTLERARNQADPLKCWDLLKAHERHYGIAVPTGASLWERRQVLDAMQDLVLGPVRANVEYQLAAALGSDFVAWVTTPADNSPRTYSPQLPWELSDHAFIPDPCGIFGQPTSWTRVRITPSIHSTGSRSVLWTHVGGDEIALAVGDRLVVDPYKRGIRELVEVTARSTIFGTRFTATFTKAHESGTEAIIWPFPYWKSASLRSLVVVPNGRATDPEVRRKASETMRKLLGGNSTWDVVEESTTPGACIGFVPGIGAPNITPIQPLTF